MCFDCKFLIWFWFFLGRIFSCISYHLCLAWWRHTIRLGWTLIIVTSSTKLLRVYWLNFPYSENAQLLDVADSLKVKPWNSANVFFVYQFHLSGNSSEVRYEIKLMFNSIEIFFSKSKIYILCSTFTGKGTIAVRPWHHRSSCVSIWLLFAHCFRWTTRVCCCHSVSTNIHVTERVGVAKVWNAPVGLRYTDATHASWCRISCMGASSH